MKAPRRLPGRIDLALARSAELLEQGIAGPVINLAILSRGFGVLARIGRLEAHEIEKSPGYARWALAERRAHLAVRRYLRRCEAERRALRGSP